MHSWRGRWLLIALEALLIVAAFAIGWLLGQPPLARCRWSSTGWIWGLAAALPMLAALAFCLAWPAGPWRSLVRLVDSLLVPIFRTWTWGELAIAAALAGVGEEMLFRGVIQDALYHLAVESITAPDVLAIVAAGVLFGLAHSITLSYAIFATLVGIYLGWLFVVVGDLTAPIVAHGFYDFIALAYLAKIRRVPPGKDGDPGFTARDEKSDP